MIAFAGPIGDVGRKAVFGITQEDSAYCLLLDHEYYQNCKSTQHEVGHVYGLGECKSSSACVMRQGEDTEWNLFNHLCSRHHSQWVCPEIISKKNKSAEVVKMVTSLSVFFRTTLSKGHDYITVKEERTHIESYLEIQQFRYQDILDYEIQMDEEIYGYIIPKLTLQPLVENALYHGIKNKRGKGKILITGKKQGDKIIFQVIDNGKYLKRKGSRKL